MNTTTLTPDQQKILQIAERYNAHPGSTLTIRGVEDVLEFADEVITDPAKIHEVFEHDQQCDDMAGVPHIPA